MQVLPGVRRAWFGVNIPGYRQAASFSTYGEFEVGSLPPIERQLDDRLEWLTNESQVDEWALFGMRDVRDFDKHRAAIATALPAGTPPAFKALLASPSIGSRIRSFTGCYIDFGWRPVPASDGGTLIHFLSDQQWVCHWLLYVGPGGHAVVATLLPFGFDAPAVDEDELSDVSRFDVNGPQAIVCTESFNEFLYRFWIENEICFRLEQDELTAEQRRYVEHYGRT